MKYVLLLKKAILQVFLFIVTVKVYVEGIVICYKVNLKKKSYIFDNSYFYLFLIPVAGKRRPLYASS